MPIPMIPLVEFLVVILYAWGGRADPLLSSRNHDPYESFMLSVERNGDNPFFGTRIRLGRWEIRRLWMEIVRSSLWNYQEISVNDYDLFAMLFTYFYISHISIYLFLLIGLVWHLFPWDWVPIRPSVYSQLIVKNGASLSKPVSSGLVTVPLYDDTLGEKAIVYICDQTEMEIIFTSKINWNF